MDFERGLVDNPPHTPIFQEADPERTNISRGGVRDNPPNTSSCVVKGRHPLEVCDDLSNFSTINFIKHGMRLFTEITFWKTHLSLAKLHLSHIKPKNYVLI